MFSLEIDDAVDKTFRKLAKKDRKQLEAVHKKIEQILNNPSQFKPLKHPLEGLRRAHVGPFVIVYEVLENAQTVRILKYSHHDEAYQ